MNAQTPEAQTAVPASPSPVKGLRLPEPDRENITVLLHNLPDAPVLPWNHYDSPWEGEEEANPEEASSDRVTDEESAEVQPSESTGEASHILEDPVADPSTIVFSPESIEPEESSAESSTLDEITGLPKVIFEPGFVNLTEGFSSSVLPPDLMEKQADQEIDSPAVTPPLVDPQADSITIEVESEATPTEPPEEIEEKLLSQLG